MVGVDMFSNSCPRSSSCLVNEKNVVCHAASIVVPVSNIEQAILSCAVTNRPQDIPTVAR